MKNTPATRKEMRTQYKELRQCANDFIIHDCFPMKEAPRMAALLRRIHELCTPAMVLCLLDDLEEAASSKKRETSMSKVFGAPYGKQKI